MAVFNMQDPWALTFGVLGNLISFMVYLAPLPTFYRVYKKKSTEGFQSVPYVVALFSAMLWIYYAFLKGDDVLLVTINSVGCFIETAYIAMYIAYAPRRARIFTSKLLMLLNIGVFGLILLLTQLLAKGPRRVLVLGWVCVAFSVSVFAAPLSIIRLVIRTKSVEFMPFFLSFFLTLSAVTWFSYGFFRKDIYIALPNVLGFIFGIIQMILYAIYRRQAKRVILEQKLTEEAIDIAKLSAPGVHPIAIQSEEINMIMEGLSQDAPTARAGDKSMASPNEILMTKCEEV
ncbi:hypothetical protein MRB53_007805 [Persea americana]|uniref:Uncharacterized protein n=1 Tax=Persea americana TaxID=3435 RepID=A0ACC2MK13_PERAE|nr:hypothetical protein MRB53_007805 [Persea americana]|eukprot:TRINITY_DN22879_c0_g1_i1.p1 TRINITY_DN22879_c0_g1~~TRINITY_DN22879_c0_g1_i1.p1  ORF type:complete len:288 (+),score=38.79 TRINITY_DN22879_c0_g1_i1:214-1077(+)